MTALDLLMAQLKVPPASPPAVVVTQLQSLPFAELRWDDFEKLCVRLARYDHEVEDARRYGVAGQVHYGIDLFARRLGTGGYTVYQCKKVKEFMPSDVSGAIDKFLAGPWAERADRFVLCTSLSLAGNTLQDQLIIETERMQERGVALKTWDADELNILLKDKDKAALVDDFFGRPVVGAFCGPEAAAGLSRRLDGRQVAEYRQRLRGLYGAVFTQLDPGLPIPPGLSDVSVDLRRRYVVPDIMESWEAGAVSVADADVRPGLPSLGAPAEAPLGWEGGGSARYERLPAGEAVYPLRRPLDAWLAGAQRCLLVGATGSGKSTALRFLTLDLLDDDPSLTEVAGHWGGRIPLWVSFPYWASLIAHEPEGVSLPDCVRRWLTSYGKPDLWELVETALTDDRLVLVVDGLDEWGSEEAAQTAAHLLQVYVQANGVPVVAAGRPHGVRRLAMQGGRWSVGEIAGLDKRQQQQVAQIWARTHFAAGRDESGPSEESGRLAEQESKRFVDQVSVANHLSELARNPMLLLLLLYFHLRNDDLPSSRFAAYEKVIDHLTADHPAARRRAALSASAPPPPALIRQALAYLSFRMQSDHAGGDVEDSVAAAYVGQALASTEDWGLGLSAPDAGVTAAEILGTAEGGFGLLVRSGAAAVRFFHRAIQEHLAAAHMTRLPLEEQCRLVAEFGTGPGWEPVILSLMWLAPRPSDVGALISSLSETAVGLAGEQRDRIRAEVAFGPFDTAAGWAQHTARQAIAAVEGGERLSHQRQLLDRVLAGIGSPRTSGLVADAVSSWIYDRAVGREAPLAAVAALPAGPEARHVLITALHDASSGAQHAAGRSIPQVFGDDPQMRALLLAAANRSQRTTTRAAALDALRICWPEDPAVADLTAWARRCGAVELVVAAIDAAVALGTSTDDDLRILTSLVSGWSHPANAWVESVPEILARGWAGNDELKAACLAAARRQWEHGPGMKKSVATAVLARAFPGDGQVAEWIADELDNAEYPFLMAHGPLLWRHLADNFHDHPVVVEAFHRWAPRQQFNDMEVALLALVSGTDQTRDLLVGRLSGASFPHWEATSLIEGWGMQDPVVADALRTYLNSPPPAQPTAIGHLVPQIIHDPLQARTVLIGMLREPVCPWADRAVSGLAQLADPGDIGEIVEAALPHLGEGLNGPLPSLIVGFPQHPQVRDLALTALGKRGAPLWAVTHAYASDPGMRQHLAAMLTPVSPPLRVQIIDALARRPISDKATTQLLEQFDAEQHGNVKVAAASAWATRVRPDLQAAAHASEQLAPLLHATGLDHEDRRRAAFAALLTLGRADVLSAKASRTGLDVLRRDTEFVRLIAEHWHTLTEALGNRRTAILSGFGDANNLWISLCTIAQPIQTFSRTCCVPSTPSPTSLQASRLSSSPP